jgi:hypothetical protein
MCERKLRIYARGPLISESQPLAEARGFRGHESMVPDSHT